MGILRNGIHGPVQGRTGALVGRVARKRNVVSAVPHKRTKPVGQKVTKHLQKFLSVSLLMNLLLPLVSLGFAYDRKRGAVQAAIRYNFDLIISQQDGGFTIDYAKLVFSRGRQAGINSPAVTITGNNTAHFNWLPEDQHEYNRSLDKVCFLIYNATRNESVVSIGMAIRSDLNYEMDLPLCFFGDDLYAYTSIVAFNDRWVSNSLYLGKI